MCYAYRNQSTLNLWTKPMLLETKLNSHYPFADCFNSQCLVVYVHVATCVWLQFPVFWAIQLHESGISIYCSSHEANFWIRVVFLHLVYTVWLINYNYLSDVSIPQITGLPQGVCLTPAATTTLAQQAPAYLIPKNLIQQQIAASAGNQPARVYTVKHGKSLVDMVSSAQTGTT